jgi:TonB family protein
VIVIRFIFKTSLFFMLFTALSASAQSERKLNKQLEADLLSEEQRQDSSYRVFVQERKILEENRNKIEDQIKNHFYSENHSLKQTEKAISRYLFALERMEIDTKDVFPDGFHRDSFPDYQTFVKPYDDPLSRRITFKYASRDFYFDDKEKLKIKNEILQESIQKYQDYTKKNIVQFQDLRYFVAKLSELGPRLDSLFRVYQSLNEEMRKKEDLLSKKFLAARENYRVKGPTGFPAAYREYFRDIHPLPADALTSTEREVERDPIIEADKERMIYSVVEEIPQYPDGRAAMMVYLRDNLIYPPSAKEKGISGKLYLRFVVSDTGEISDVRVMRGIEDCPECNDEAIRLVKSMPRWIPGKEKGRAVSSYFNLPVLFESNK